MISSGLLHIPANALLVKASEINDIYEGNSKTINVSSLDQAFLLRSKNMEKNGLKESKDEIQVNIFFFNLYNFLVYLYFELILFISKTIISTFCFFNT